MDSRVIAPGTGDATEKRIDLSHELAALRASGRRAFMRNGAVAAASAVVATTAGTAFGQTGNPNYLPSLYRGQNAQEFQAIQSHENAHVTFLVNALGAAARPKPSFVNLLQPDLVTFAKTSRALENTGCRCLPWRGTHHP